MLILLFIIQSLIIVLPFVLGLFLFFSPSARLQASYQDFMLRYTRKPLKDEDFLDVSRKIILAKLLGAAMLAFSLIMAVLFILAKSPLSFFG